MAATQPRFPLYLPTKGRSKAMVTSRALSRQGVAHYLVVEPQEVTAYQRAVAQGGLLGTVLPLDLAYKARYELCDDLGLTKSTGPGPARNFAWDHAVAAGHTWHWVMDDNIQQFYRLHANTKIQVWTPACWVAMEAFVLRYDNVAMAGPNYEFFAPARAKMPPFVRNTRIYSCNLIRNDVPFRWRGRYNEDTILSLDMLKAGWCTVQFNAFLQKKVWTQVMSGGNTAEFYAREGTRPKSEMLQRVHPDVTRLVWRFQRHHHHVDYRPFLRNVLRRRPDAAIPDHPDNFGMVLARVAKPRGRR